MPRTARLLLAALSGLAVLGQTGSNPAPPAGSSANLILVRFQMTPAKGQSAELRPGDIQLTEDGAAQKVAFAEGGSGRPLTVPIEVHLLFDDFRESESRVGPWWLRDQSLDLSAFDDHGRVSVAVWTIGDGLMRLTPPTRDPGALKGAVDGMWDKWAETPLNAPAKTVPFNRSVAALADSLAQIRTDAVRMIVPLTSACDSEEKEPADAIRRAGIPVFPVWFQNFASWPNRKDESFEKHQDARRDEAIGYQSGVPYWSTRGLAGYSAHRCYTYGQDYALTSVAGKTGGRNLFLSVMSHNTYGQFIEWVGDQIRADYVVGFYPAAAGSQKAHRVRVALKDPGRGKIAGGEQTITH
jgi:hypothetical protein